MSQADPTPKPQIDPTPDQQVDPMAEQQVDPKDQPASKMRVYIPRLGNPFPVQVTWTVVPPEKKPSGFVFAFLSDVSPRTVQTLWGQTYSGMIDYASTSKEYDQGYPVVSFRYDTLQCVAVSDSEVTLFLQLDRTDGSKWCDKIILLPTTTGQKGEALYAEFVKNAKVEQFTVENPKLLPPMYQWLQTDLLENYQNDPRIKLENFAKKYFTREGDALSPLIKDAIKKDITCDLRRVLHLLAHRLLERQKNEVFDYREDKNEFKGDFMPPESWKLFVADYHANYEHHEFEAGKDMMPLEPDCATNWYDPPIYKGRGAFVEEEPVEEQINGNREACGSVIDYSTSRMRFYGSMYDRWYTIDSIDFSDLMAEFKYKDASSPRVDKVRKARLNPANVHYCRRLNAINVWDQNLTKPHSFAIYMAHEYAYYYFRCDSALEMDYLVKQFHAWMDRNNAPMEPLEQLPNRTKDDTEHLRAFGDQNAASMVHVHWPKYTVSVQYVNASEEDSLLTEAAIMDDCYDLFRRKLDKLAALFISLRVDFPDNFVRRPPHTKHGWIAPMLERNWNQYWLYRLEWDKWFDCSVPGFIRDPTYFRTDAIELEVPKGPRAALTIPYQVLYPTYASPDCRIRVLDSSRTKLELVRELVSRRCRIARPAIPAKPAIPAIPAKPHV